LVFVIQKHAATRLHYDLRLEVGGVMKSWAVPKGASLNPEDKRLAVHVEDHPMEYNKFEGIIPKGQYGGGEVIIWDRGSYEVEGDKDAEAQLARGDFKFTLHGEKLRGSFVLVQLKNSKDKKDWLLIKHRDEFVDTEWDAEKDDQSVVSGRTLEDVRLGRKLGKARTEKVWQSNREEKVAGRRPGGTAVEVARNSARGMIGQRTDYGALEGARKAEIPRDVALTLASLRDRPFSDPEWLFEVKWDGVRGLAFVADGKISVKSRAGREIVAEYPEVEDLRRQLNAREAIVDGEIVALDDDGRSNFQKLQSRSGVRNPSRTLLEAVPATYYAFDLLYCDGYDLRKVPLEKRKEALKKILRPGGNARFSEHQVEKGKELYDAARQQGLEGIIGKKRHSAYVGGRTSLWLKFKIVDELDAVVCGWTSPRKSREYFGALVLGLYDQGELKFIGAVGTGFTQDTQKSVYEQLQELRQSKSTFGTPLKLKEAIQWVQPELIARVKYGNWTDGKRLRAPVFLGLRTDISPEECTLNSEENAENSGSVTEEERRREGLEKVEAKEKRGRSAKGWTGRVVAREVGQGKRRVAPAATNGEKAVRKDVEAEIRRGTSEGLGVEVDGQLVKLTHLNKMYFPESEIRKRDLLAYYLRMGELMLPFLKERPLVLRRYPNGIREKAFFQKEAPESIPEWLARATVHSEGRGGDMPYIMAENVASILYLTNLGCIDHNPWSSRAESQDTPDYVFFDLDPTPGTPFLTVLKIARTIYDILHSIRLTCFLKTSGASGFHIFVPLVPQYTYDQTRAFAELVGRIASERLPGLITFERMVRKRVQGKVLMDALQNARGKPLATVYSVRAYPGAPVSTPVTIEELQRDFSAEQWNLKTIERRLQRVGNLWKDFWKRRQSLSKALELLSKEISR
jgi:bifunctional non-homologous end joining protein LigD